MAQPIRKPTYYNSAEAQTRKTVKPVVKSVKFEKKSPNSSAFRRVVLIVFAAILFKYVFPFMYVNYTRPLFIGPVNEAVTTNYWHLYNPTTDYLKNDLFAGENFLKGAEEKHPAMQSMAENGNMPVLNAKLNSLISQYPTVTPSVYVWDYETGKSVNIKSEEQFPAASIIKVPVLLELFRSIEAGQVNIEDRMHLTEYYRSGGSGELQYSPAFSTFSIDKLARVMIQNSDNTATNMLMSDMGGMVDVNSAIRNWGIKHTYVQNWLPDLGGTNLTCSKDIATMLYNIDNPSFLSLKSRGFIVDYMSHVKNNRLIQAGLPKNAIFMHKTGDIGTMLGDAGIVWTPNGKKYIVVILAKRPYNSPQGKDFIVKASTIIYDAISSRTF